MVGVVHGSHPGSGLSKAADSNQKCRRHWSTRVRGPGFGLHENDSMAAHGRRVWNIAFARILREVMMKHAA